MAVRQSPKHWAVPRTGENSFEHDVVPASKSKPDGLFDEVDIIASFGFLLLENNSAQHVLAYQGAFSSRVQPQLSGKRALS